MLEALDHLLLAIIEGFSEFLPVSSTGHMILYDELLTFGEKTDKTTYMVVIQAGAILAVVHLYFNQLVSWTRQTLTGKDAHGIVSSVNARTILLKIGAAVVPFGLIGFIFKDHIKALFSSQSVACALIAGGILLILDDLFRNKKRKSEDSDQLSNNTVINNADTDQKIETESIKNETHTGSVESLTWKQAMIIGVAQCAALWPGFSRSAATLLGARFCGYNPIDSARLSFLIGLPTLLGTAGYEFLSGWQELQVENGLWIVAGSLVAWFTAFISVKWFLKIVGKGGLLGFGVYRCILGILILTCL